MRRDRGEHGEDSRPPAGDRRPDPPPRAGRGGEGQGLEGAAAAPRGGRRGQRARLDRIEELAASFAEIEARGEATSVFQEMTRILAEQGVDEAIAYVESQRSDILKTVAARASAAHQANRAHLQPLLKAAALNSTKGQSAAAREPVRGDPGGRARLAGGPARLLLVPRRPG